jgi:hypothetical protein
MKFVRECFRCVHYVVLEERAGLCKLFGDFKHARESEALCGKIGRYFKYANTVPRVDPSQIQVQKDDN